MIRIDHLSLQLSGFALQGIDMTVGKGEFFALIGPTGAGKTLVLESIAGLSRPSEGRILIDGVDVTALPPERREVGIVYQDHALFPHLNVRQNITYGLRYHRGAGTGRGRSLELLVERLGLACLLDRSVDNLSGGERQRVALARALAIDPAVLLLDEPLSSLDPNFREEIRELLKELHRDTGITALMVTHDFAEAHFLARRVAVMNEGRIEQAGLVREVFFRPATEFAARFVGMKNIFPASFHDGRARVGGLSFEVSAGFNGQARLAVRPEQIRLSESPPAGSRANSFQGRITRIGNQGLFCDVAVAVSDIEFQTILPASRLHAMNLAPGDRVFVEVPPGDIHLI